MMQLVSYNSFKFISFVSKNHMTQITLFQSCQPCVESLPMFLAWILLGSRQLQSGHRTELYWCCGHCQKLGLRTLGGFKTFGKTAFAALNLKSVSSPKL